MIVMRELFFVPQQTGAHSPCANGNDAPFIAGFLQREILKNSTFHSSPPEKYVLGLPQKNVQELDKNANEQIFIPEGLFSGGCQQWPYVMEYKTRYLEGSRLLIKETKVITYSKLTSD